MEYTALIVAAGSGSRMGLGYNKLLFKLANGNTILEETLLIFCKDKRCKQIVMVISKEDEETFKQLFKDVAIDFVIGGDTRQDSVYNGLHKATQEYVCIHDGARPWLSMECLNRLLENLECSKACLLMVPSKDTVKIVEAGKVVSTPDRSTLWQAQTPQSFLTSAIVEAYEKAKQSQIVASDDAQIMELCGGYEVEVVEGSYDNLKVTTKEDIVDK